MADGNPPRLRGTRCPVAGFSNQPNAQPEMTAKIFRAKPLVRFSYSLNPLGAQFSVCWIDVPLGSPAP